MARSQRCLNDSKHLCSSRIQLEAVFGRRDAERAWACFRIKRKKPAMRSHCWLHGGDGGIRTHGPLRIKRFRVFYSEHTLADFEKKCPILRVNALVRKKMIFSPLRLFPTVRNARELSERTNRTAIKHNNRKSP